MDEEENPAHVVPESEPQEEGKRYSMDPIGGDDRNDGSPGSPLRTCAEVIRRMTAEAAEGEVPLLVELMVKVP